MKTQLFEELLKSVRKGGADSPRAKEARTPV